jgi:hypothetical protein
VETEVKHLPALPWTAEQISWVKPGTVSSAERASPDGRLRLNRQHRAAVPRQRNRGGQAIRTGTDHNSIVSGW